MAARPDLPGPQRAKLVPGAVFDTAHERDCIVKTSPDELGNFLGWDSDDVLCQHSVVMVTRVGEVVCDV